LPLLGDSRSAACFAAEAENGLQWNWHLQTARTQLSHLRRTLCTGWDGALSLQQMAETAAAKRVVYGALKAPWV